MNNLEELVILLNDLKSNSIVEVNTERLHQLIIQNNITPEEFDKMYKDFENTSKGVKGE